MKAYFDSSVVLRLALRQPGSLKEWMEFEDPHSSELCRLETLRKLDRMRLEGRYPASEINRLDAKAAELLKGLYLIDWDRRILLRASQPFPRPVTTLDSIHLATALSLRESTGEEWLFATHDEAQAEAAKAMGLEVAGV